MVDALVCRLVHELGHGLLRVRLVGMAGLGADDVGHLHAVLEKRGFHEVGGGFLRVVLAAVGHERGVGEVDGARERVVEIPEFLLIPRDGGEFVAELLVVLHVHETRAGIDRSELVWVMRAEVPRARAAHREAAHGEFVAVNRVVLRRVVEAFPHVRLARELEGVHEAAVGVEHEGVVGQERAARALLAFDEGDLVERVAAPVQPEVEAAGLVIAGEVSHRNLQPVRLHRAVNLRHVAVHDGDVRERGRRLGLAFEFLLQRKQTGLRVPRGVASGELLGALGAGLEQRAGGVELVGAREDVVLQRVADGVVVNLHVRQEGEQRRLAGE